MTWFRVIDGQYTAQPTRGAPGRPLMSKKGLRAVKAAFDRLRGPPSPRAVSAGPPIPWRRWRPPVVHDRSISTPRSREGGARMVAAGGRDGTAERDDGGGSDGDGGGGGEPPPQRSGGVRVLERGRGS
jgi:hypothetical protein